MLDVFEVGARITQHAISWLGSLTHRIVLGVDVTHEYPRSPAGRQRQAELGEDSCETEGGRVIGTFWAVNDHLRRNYGVFRRLGLCQPVTVDVAMARRRITMDHC